MIIIDNNGHEYTAYDSLGNKILSVEYTEVEETLRKYEDVTFCRIESITAASEDLELKLSALLEIIKQQFAEYANCKLDNYYKDLTSEEELLIGILIQRGLVAREILLDQDTDIPGPDLSTPEVRENLIQARTMQRKPGTDREGSLHYNSKVVLHHPRSYKSERTAQIMRQVSTQLYFYCRANNLSPVEVQMMFMMGNIFISANDANSVDLMRKKLTNKDAWREILTTTYELSDESKIVSARHARKIADRIYGDRAPYPDPRFKLIRQLLLQPKICNIKLKPGADLEMTQAGGIYFVCNRAQPGRHAEENLLDIFRANIPNAAFEKKFKTAIFGKMRPCFSCHSSLEAEANFLIEDANSCTHEQPFEFNPHRGMFFKGVALKQDAAAARATFSNLGAFEKKSHVSTFGDSSYATASDTDESDAEEVEKIKTPKPRILL